ncbi:AMP-binding protein [Heliorestis convoluta]|uniref:2-acylglycerophosphoethanolamine acyltransferase n=1 Tax=Heliorestis convoluta TaxID=356322 RepID=A0A5Q2N6U5_9FIRM|nr:AMP-binding protein [Heliorestis convoluta]QGG48275.1 2-acylglycerophosphoethanolamine acyltransferase [Heliorestis convoluta]
MNWHHSLYRTLFQKLYKLKLLHFDRIKNDSGPTIVMSNYVSSLDALILALYLPPEYVFLVNKNKKDSFQEAFRLRKYITFDMENPASLREVINSIKKGTKVIIFPEDRPTMTNGILKVYEPYAYIAMKSGATIYPIGIEGTQFSPFSTLSDTLPIRDFPEVTVYVDKPFSLFSEDRKSSKNEKTLVANQMVQALQQALFYARHRENINLFDELIKTAKIYGWKRQIVEDMSQKATYKDLLLGAYALGDKLKKELREQERVAILLPNSIGHLVTLLALFRQNITPAILNFTTGPQGLIDCCESAEIKTLLTSRLFIEKAELNHLIAKLSEKVSIVYLEDIKKSLTSTDKLKALTSFVQKRKALPGKNQLILFTSGSENKPKGVLLRHENIRANLLQAVGVVDLTAKDKLLNPLPMFHSFGLQGAFLPLFTGINLYLYPTPLHYKAIPEIAYNIGATLLFATSTFLHGYLQNGHSYDFQAMRYLIVGGEKLKEETRRLSLDKYGLRPLEGYGCTEASPFISINRPMHYKAGTVGFFLPAIEHRLEPIEGIARGGKLLVKGPNVMEGYLIHGKGFIPVEEWYDCGDLVDIDEEGFISILSRVKRFAKLGGEMVSLNLLEELAGQCFGTTEVAAISVSGGRKGEELLLFTTDQQASKATLRDFIVASGHTPLLVPSHIRYIEQMPLLGSGKTDYVTLKSLYADGI